MKPDGSAAVHRALIGYLALLSVLFQAAWLVALVSGSLLHKPYPFNTFLFDPSARFSDFTIYYTRFSHFEDGLSFFTVPSPPFTYPAPCLIGYLIFMRLFADPLMAYLCVLIAAVTLGWATLCTAIARNCRDRVLMVLVVTATVLLSYPFLFLLDRANIEGLVWIVVFAGSLALVREKYAWAGGLFAVAAAMKIFPGLLLLLLLPKKRYGALVVAAIAGAGVTLASLAAIGPSIPEASRAIAAGLESLRTQYVVQYRWGEIGFDHSLFGCIKQVLHVFARGTYLNRLLAPVSTVYLVTVSVGFGALYYLRIRKLPVLNQFFALIISMITLPFVSNDYTLVHLYLPWGAFMVFLAQDVLSGRVRLSTRQAMAFLAPCAVIFTPQSYLLFEGNGCGGQVKALALLLLLWASVSIPLPSSIFHDAPAIE